MGRWKELFKELVTGKIAEPSYSLWGRSYVPPPDWTQQCQICGARTRPGTNVCWYCGTILMLPPPGAGRRFTCPACNRQMTEPNFGDLDKGLNCFYCYTDLIGNPPQIRCRGNSLFCPVCSNEIWERVTGDLLRNGVICPYCHTHLIGDPPKIKPST